MSKTTNGHIITQDLDGTDHLDCLYRISLKALIYNDTGQILVVKEIDRMYVTGAVCVINFLTRRKY
mgnify:CR=1 FL=1